MACIPSSYDEYKIDTAIGIYIYRRLGGESNREIVSFRVVRACARCGIIVGNRPQPESLVFPFSPSAGMFFSPGE